MLTVSAYAPEQYQHDGLLHMQPVLGLVEYDGTR